MHLGFEHSRSETIFTLVDPLFKELPAYEVLNPTSDTYEFHWMPEETEKKETEDPFRCLSKPCPKIPSLCWLLLVWHKFVGRGRIKEMRRGTILPGKKYEMLFEYLPAAAGMCSLEA